MTQPTLSLELDTGATVTRLHEPRHTFDAHLIPAAEAGRINYRTLLPADRAWLIAQLTHKGIPAQVIADKLHCSLRTIKSIRNTDPVAILTIQLLTAQAEAAQRQARTRPDTAAQVIADYVRTIDQLKAKNDRLFDALASTKARCTQTAPCPVTVVFMPHRYRRHPKPPNQPALFEEMS